MSLVACIIWVYLPRLEGVGICILCRYTSRYSASKQLLDTPQVDTPLPYSPNPRPWTFPCRLLTTTSNNFPLPSTYRLKLPTIRVLYSSLRVLSVIFAYHHPHSTKWSQGCSYGSPVNPSKYRFTFRKVYRHCDMGRLSGSQQDSCKVIHEVSHPSPFWSPSLSYRASRQRSLKVYSPTAFRKYSDSNC